MKRSELSPEQLEQARQARNAAARAWRKNNPDRYREIQAKYWLKKSQKAMGGVQHE